MSVLAAPLSLGDGPGRIDDVEALVRKVVEDRLRQWGAKLKEFEREDLISYLIGVCWELSGRYDPAKDRNPNFASYAARILTLRVADWYRQRFGDTRHGDKPVVLSLDAFAGWKPEHLSGVDNPAAQGSDRLVDTLAASTGDPAEDCSPDLIGILERRGPGRDRRENRAPAHDPLGKPKTRRASRGARQTAVVKKPKPVVHSTGIKRAPNRAPICSSCFKTFRKAFTAVNKHVPAERKLDAEQIADKAKLRAQAVKFGTEWACPRCTKLNSMLGQKLLLEEAYPNRNLRRKAVKATKRRNDGTAKRG